MSGRPLTRALGLALGFGLDRLLGDPRRGHPVALFGRAAAALERRTYADTVPAGAVHVGLLVGGTAAGAALVGSLARRHPVAEVAWTAAVTWVVLGGRSLEREAAAVAAHLDRGDLEAAREQVSHLVGRDPWSLDGAGVTRATIESLAENTSDAVVAPLVWGALAGPVGMVAHRATNTLDAMIGYRNDRYERFGKVAARLDDVVNWAPARLGAALAAGTSPEAWGAIRRDAPAHPSPNGGKIEAAFAGALGIRLGGTNAYGGRIEHRGELGTGRAPAPADVGRAIRLARRVQLGTLVLAVAGVVLGGRVTRRPRSH
ncbi:adenosylcobinamide-phosphate synthase [Raineyella antarctica]|uniref:Cobalamin biosynthesis protein CobD n=1 Tax=Raineyella antarctica TaxID=1577474 RepID=A0A1G6GG80_9ACTN|nr:cobalamin biosynthesis protein [Raineyella antarctica]SDB80997.1 adenosylcobinamide-phosphate synthase [Raineyella antarctica]